MVLSVTRELEQVFWFAARLQVAAQASCPGLGAGESEPAEGSGLGPCSPEAGLASCPAYFSSFSWNLEAASLWMSGSETKALNLLRSRFGL